MVHPRGVNSVRLIGVLVVVLVATACTAASPSAPASSRPARTAPAAVSPITRPAGHPVAFGVRLARVDTAGGSVITVAVFRGPVRYILHDASVDPVSASSRLVRARPVIGAAERGRMLAAFNGGFLMRSHAGGYEQEGHVFKALQDGLA